MLISKKRKNGILLMLVCIIIAGGTLVSPCCNSIQNLGKTKIRAINLSVNWEFVNAENGQIAIYPFDIDISYHENLVMFRDRIPYLEFGKRTTYESNDTVYAEQELINDSTDERTKYRFFIYRQGDSQGLMYDALNTLQGQLFDVDSLLKVKALKGGAFYDDNDSLVETVNNPEGYEKLKKYVPKIKYNESYADSNYFYFSDKLNDIKYSFSPLLDSVEGLKLSKIVSIYKRIPKGGLYKVDIPQRQMLFEIKEIEIDDPEGIIALFERFKKSMAPK